MPKVKKSMKKDELFTLAKNLEAHLEHMDKSYDALYKSRNKNIEMLKRDKQELNVSLERAIDNMNVAREECEESARKLASAYDEIDVLRNNMEHYRKIIDLLNKVE